MRTGPVDPQVVAAAAALAAPEVSVRLRAAMAVGSLPRPDLVEVLVQRCGSEQDPFVRDALTWALTRLPADVTLPHLRRELDAAGPQARAQALHTLSKVGAGGAWPWITPQLLADPDDDVARAAWRAAVALAPEAEHGALAEQLARQLGRGDQEVQRSLSRALVQLGPAAEQVLQRAGASPRPEVAAHATAALHLLHHPDAPSGAALAVAERARALGRERTAALHATPRHGAGEPGAAERC